MVFSYKLLYINILSFLLQFLLLIWYSGTVGHLGHFCKNFSNSYRFAYNWILQHFPPLLKRIIQLHDNAVSRDKILIGTPDIVSGLIDNA